MKHEDMKHKTRRAGARRGRGGLMRGRRAAAAGGRGRAPFLSLSLAARRGRWAGGQCTPSTLSGELRAGRSGGATVLVRLLLFLGKSREDFSGIVTARNGVCGAGSAAAVFGCQGAAAGPTHGYAWALARWAERRTRGRPSDLTLQTLRCRPAGRRRGGRCAGVAHCTSDHSAIA